MICKLSILFLSLRNLHSCSISYLHSTPAPTATPLRGYVWNLSEGNFGIQADARFKDFGKKEKQKTKQKNNKQQQQQPPPPQIYYSVLTPLWISKSVAPNIPAPHLFFSAKIIIVSKSVYSSPPPPQRDSGLNSFTYSRSLFTLNLGF